MVERGDSTKLNLSTKLMILHIKLNLNLIEG